MPPLPFSREISFFLQSHGYIPVLHPEKITENWPGGLTIALCSQASSFSRTSLEFFHVSGCGTAHTGLSGCHHQVQAPDAPSAPGCDAPLQLPISSDLFRSTVYQIQLHLLFSFGSPGTHNDLDPISAFAYVSMQMSCKMLSLLCLSLNSCILTDFFLMDHTGIEPVTFRLWGECSTAELMIRILCIIKAPRRVPL